MNERFDDLARRKLEDRAFPFDEGAWLDAQEALAARRRKRRGAWLFLLLPMAFVAWLLWPAGNQPSALTEAQRDPAPAVTEQAAPEPHAPTPAAASEHSTTAPNAIEPATTNPAISAEPRSTPVRTHKSAAPNSAPRSAANPEPVKASATDALRIADSFGVSIPVVPDNLSDRRATILHRGDEGSPSDGSESKAPPVVPPASVANGDATATPAVVIPEPDAPQPQAAPSLPEPMPQASTATDSLHAQTQDPVPSPAASDSATVAEPAPLLPPTTASRSPWEITALFGAQSTTSRYTSERFPELKTEAGLSPAFGAEFVRMGRNTGFGFGVHHHTYHDRLITPEQRTTAWEVNRNWFLQSVDTTILVITGTDTVNGQVVYTGFNVPSTIQILSSTYDTTTTVSVRAAREHAVRMSYLEVPLLLDAHLVQGRWSFGVRGGPSIGLLTARSGSLPSGNDEPSAGLRDATVRQWSVGWTARAYVRYRFNSAWSVGLEPMARGQLVDAIEGPVVTRRSNAFGALLSLGYRLR